MKKVILTTGGTGGHIYPALSIADKLKEKDIDLLFVGSNRMEKDLVPQKGYSFIALDIIPFRSIKSVYKLIKSMIKAFKIVKKYKPDAIIGFGNYISIPVLLAGLLCGKKLYIQEQNSEMGMANKLFYRFCKKSFLAFDKTYEELPIKYHKKLMVTGNPLREEYYHLNRNYERENLKIGENEKLLLITGGSLGAKSINDEILRQWDRVFAEKNIRLYWATGKNNFNDINNKITKLKPNDIVKPYFDNMPNIMVASDLMICRSGALTLSEIVQLEKPSILIPLGVGGQQENAKMLGEKEAALIYENENITDAFEKALEIILNENELAKISRNLKLFKKDKAVDKIISELDIWGNN